jgi:hypothetical protein
MFKGKALELPAQELFQGKALGLPAQELFKAKSSRAQECSKAEVKCTRGVYLMFVNVVACQL